MVSGARSVRLTKKLVDLMSADPNRETWIWDTEVRGFFLRVYPTGAKTFAAKYRANGRQRIFTIGRFGSPWTVEKARERAVEILYEASGDGDPALEKRKRRAALSVTALIDRYLADGPRDKPNKRQSTWESDRRHLKRHVTPLLGHMKADAVTRNDVANMQADIAAGKTSTDQKTKKRGRAIVKGGPRSASMTVVVLQAMYNWAIKRGLVAENPARGVERYKSEPKERFLTPDELAVLFATLQRMVEDDELGTDLASAIRLLALTGARKTEIAALRWSEVDFARGAIHLSELRCKTGRRRIVLSAHAQEELQTLCEKRGDSPYVFPAKRGNGPTLRLQDAWEVVRIEAGLEGVRLHDLRHTFASLAAANGESLYLIGKALGHTQARTTERYAHISSGPVRAIGDLVSGQIKAAEQARVAARDLPGEASGQ